MKKCKIKRIARPNLGRAIRFILFINLLYGLVFVPAFDLDVRFFQSAESRDESIGQSGIGYQRDIEIDSAAANRIVVIQLVFGKVFRNVYDQIDFFVPNIIQGVGFVVLLVGPSQYFGMNTVFFEEFRAAFGRIYLIPFFLQ